MSQYNYDTASDDELAEFAEFQKAKRDRAAAEAAANAPIDYENSPDPREEGRKAFEETMAKGGTREDGMAEHFAHLVQAAAKNDRRVLIDPLGDRG